MWATARGTSPAGSDTPHEEDSVSEQVDFDLDKATDEAWQQFEERLAEVLSVIDPGGELVIGTLSTHTDPSPALQFFCRTGRRASDERMLHAEASSNEVLGETFQLSVPQLQAMVDLGWTEPSAVGSEASPNFTHDHSQDDSLEVAELSVRTLRDVYGVQHPAFLAPDQLAEVLQPEAEPLVAGPDPEQTTSVMPRNAAHLSELVMTDLTRLFGHAPFRDSEGDIAIRVGSTIVFVRCTPDAREIVVFSVLVHDVEGRSRAMELLNDLNTESRFGRFALHRDKVLCSMSLLAEPFVPMQLRTALKIMSDIADGIDDDLAHKLRGRTTFSDGPDA